MKRLVSLLLMLVMLSVVSPAMANGTEPTCNCDGETGCEVTLKRVVEVEVLKNGGTILNVTEVNQTLNDWVYAKFGKNIGYQDGTFDYQVETKEIYRHLTKGRDLKFSEVRVHNNTASFSFYVLSYSAKTATYNFSLVTRIIKGGKENYFVTVINIAPKDKKKFAPFADVIEIRSKTTLAEHYRILAKVLSKMESEASWDKARNELKYLSRVVERELREYDIEGTGVAVVASGSGCSFLCGILLSTITGTICAFAGGIPGLVCTVASAIGSEIFCSGICEEYPNFASMTCSGACGIVISKICDRASLAKPLCVKVLTNLQVCPTVCALIGDLFSS